MSLGSSGLRSALFSSACNAEPLASSNGRNGRGTYAPAEAGMSAKHASKGERAGRSLKGSSRSGKGSNSSSSTQRAMARASGAYLARYV